jgi:hypothetical protein
MKRLGDEPDVIALATELGIKLNGDAAEAVVAYCLKKIDAWLVEDGPVCSVAELEAVAASRLGILFEDINSDDDLHSVIAKYVALGEGVFNYLKHDLDGNTFGATYSRSKADITARDRLIAIIDCRGQKRARRFFTRWHEIAHFLAANKTSETPVHRSTNVEPLEKLMDEIAARVGFYEPIFGPVFDAQLAGREYLSFPIVEAVRANGFGQASFQSTLFACLRQFRRPAVYLEAELAHKADDARNIRQGRLFADTIPIAQLRAVTTIPNPAAKGKLFIVPKIRIPPTSIINTLFLNEFGDEASAIENLRTWEHSGGKHLADKKVWIEAKKLKNRVIAIIQI